MSEQWFILQVGTNREEKVLRSLRARVASSGLESLVPQILVVSQRHTEIKAGQRRIVERKVYPGYVMIEIRTVDDGAIPVEVWHLIRETARPVRFVGTPDKPDKPLPMTPLEVAKMMRQVEALCQAEVPIAVDFEKGERVRVKESSFAGFEGTVDEVHPEKGIVKVTVMVFGRPTPIDFEYWKVEKVET